MPDEENRFNALKAVFSQLMADATLTPLFNYHYRISASRRERCATDTARLV